jgi:hypothetical protein
MVTKAEFITKNTEKAVGLIDEKNWEWIEGLISDLLSDASPYRHKPQAELIDNIFHQIWYTQDVQFEYGDELNDDECDLFHDCVNESVKQQVKVGYKRK